MSGLPSAELLSARTLVSQHEVPKSGLWKGFSGAPTAAKAAVGYLGLPSLSRARLLAGDPWRRVGWVHVVDVPEPASWVRPGQLVLTTGYAWPRKAPALRCFT
jgi:hypothetical protein